MKLTPDTSMTTDGDRSAAVPSAARSSATLARSSSPESATS